MMLKMTGKLKLKLTAKRVIKMYEKEEKNRKGGVKK